MRANAGLLSGTFALACGVFWIACSDNPSGCLVDIDCPASQICDQGQCVNNDCLGGCPSGKYCSKNVCAICQDDWHCGEKCFNCKGATRNKVCRNGVCGCNSADDCSQEESCVEGNCQNVALCGNGQIDPGETCHETGLHACPTSCDDGNPCTSDLLTGSAQNCNSACSHSIISQCQGDDGCCPSNCASGSDSDCSAFCGNGTVDPGETCGEPGLPLCPDSCDDGNPCTNDLMTGSAQNCNTACSHSPITQCQSGDSCCPSNCTSGMDSDCSAFCGNGAADPGETCGEPGLPACPTSCDDEESCTSDLQTGSAQNCNATCSHSTISQCQGGDGCCPSGCTNCSDTDCPACLDSADNCCPGNCGPENDTDCRELYAVNELSFIRAIYPNYVGADTDYGSNGPTFYKYREICDQAMMSFIDRRAQGLAITASDPDFLMMASYLFPEGQTHSGIYLLFDNFPAERWIVAVPTYQCLFAANLAKSALSIEQKDKLLADMVIVADFVYQNHSVEHYKTEQLANQGNTQAEEVGWTATLLATAAKLIPAPYLDDIKRTNYLTRAEDLVRYSYGHGGDQPFMNGTWLVANHQMRPNPAYTQSLLTAYAELAMLYRQDRTPGGEHVQLPNWLSDGLFQDALSNIGTALLSVVDNNFRAMGAYQLIKYDGTSLADKNYSSNTYTMRQHLIPSENIQAHTQFLFNGELFNYAIQADRIWKYTCSSCNDSCASCSASFTDTVANQMQNLTFDPPIPSNNLDAMSQYVVGGNTIYTYAFQGDRVWHYLCSPGCVPQYTQTLSEFFQPVQNQIAAWNPPVPTTSIDAFSHFIDTDGTGNHYLYQGDRLWHYHCASGTCTAQFTNTLTSQWQSLNFDPPLPTQDLDAVSQWMSGDGATLNTYVIKGDTIWHYHCPRPSGNCTPVYSKLLGEYWRSISNQEVWSTEVFDTIRGTVDWGFDCAIQNNAYAVLAFLGGQWSRYSLLQQEQVNRGLTTHPFFPPRYENGHWSYDGGYIRYFSSAGGGILADNFEHVEDASAGTLHIEPIPSLHQKLNQHFVFNSLAGYNHSIAFLLVTKDRHIEPF